jgi:hypothetical protein
MTEGIFPKVDGDILYASEVNKFVWIYTIPENADANKYIHSYDAISNIDYGSYTKVKTITLAGIGTAVNLSVYFEMTSTSTSTAYGKIYKNGSPIGTERIMVNSPSYTYSGFEETLGTFTDGDTLELWGYKTNTGSPNQVRYFRILGYYKPSIICANS